MKVISGTMSRRTEVISKLRCVYKSTFYLPVDFMNPGLEASPFSSYEFATGFFTIGLCLITFFSDEKYVFFVYSF